MTLRLMLVFVTEGVGCRGCFVRCSAFAVRTIPEAMVVYYKKINIRLSILPSCVEANKALFCIDALTSDIESVTEFNHHAGGDSICVPSIFKWIFAFLITQVDKYFVQFGLYVFFFPPFYIYATSLISRTFPFFN